MSYLTFLFVFLVPAILALLILNRRVRLETPNLGFGASLLMVGAIAFFYTTPWDNYLVYAGIWYYGDARVLGTLWYVPYEEYAFFLLQPVMTGLFLRLLLSRNPKEGAPNRLAGTVLLVISATFALIGAAGLYSGIPRFQYGSLILAWAGPVLLGLSGFAFSTHVRRAGTILAGIAIPTVYLWVADAIAIRLGIWTISTETSLGIEPFGLPIEEALFFLVTNALVVLGLMTFLYGRGRGSVQAE